MALLFVLRANWRPERFLFVRAPGSLLRFDRVALDGGEHDRRLLSAHHRDARIRPHPEKSRSERTAAHSVVAGAVAAADDDGEFGHLRTGDGSDHLRAVARDAARLVFLPDHETRDVLQEKQRNAALRAELDEVRSLQRRLRIENAVVRDDAERIAAEAREAGHERRPVARLELVELAGVEWVREHLANSVRLPDVGIDDTVDLVGRKPRLQRLAHLEIDALRTVQIADDPARNGKRMVVVEREVVGDTGHARVDVGATQVFRRYD